MVSNLIFSYSGWFFILPVPASAFCNLGSVAGSLACEDRGKTVVEYLRLLHILGNKGSLYLPGKAHIFPRFLFTFSLDSFYHQHIYRNLDSLIPFCTQIFHFRKKNLLKIFLDFIPTTVVVIKSIYFL